MFAKPFTFASASSPGLVGVTVGEEEKAVEGRGLRRIGDLVLRGFTCSAPVEARDGNGLEEGGVFGGGRGMAREGSLGGV